MSTYTIGFEKIGIDLSRLKNGKYSTCPFCSHTRKKKHQKCMIINAKTGNYNCSHCGEKGRVDSDEWISKQKEQDNKTVEAAEATKNEQKRIEAYKSKIQESQKQPSKPFLKHEPTESIINYFKGRKIGKECVLRAGIKTDSKGRCIAFNYFSSIQDGSKIVNAKYRALNDKKFWQHANAPKRVLYGLDILETTETEINEAIICEGEFDALSWQQIGLVGLSISQGAPTPNSAIGDKLKCLENSADLLKNRKVYIAVDNDEPGRYLQKVLIDKFGRNCYVIEIPKLPYLNHEGKTQYTKDANDILVHFGEKRLMQLFDSAKMPKIAGITELRDVRQKMRDIRKYGYKAGEDCGWPLIDEYIKYTKGTWTLGFGMPSMGKSEIEKFRMLLMALNKGWKFGVFTPEHHPAEDFYCDMVEILTGKDINDEYEKPTEKEFEVAMDFIEDHFFFIYPEDAQKDDVLNTPTNVLKLASDLVLRRGIDALVIDPYNQMLPEQKQEARDMYLAKVLGMVDSWAKKHNTHVTIVHHTKQQSNGGEGKDFPVPNVYAPNGGAMWNNKTYLQYVTHRPNRYSNPSDTSVIIEVQKVKKQGRMGKLGQIDLKFDMRRKWYYQFDISDSPLYGVFDKMMGYDSIDNQLANSNLNNCDDIPF